MKQVVKASAVLLVIFTILATQAEASFIDIGISARVREVYDFNGVLGGASSVGDIINGMYSYESTTPDSHSWSNIGQYQYTTAPAGVTLSVNGLTFRTDPSQVDFLIEVGNAYINQDHFLFHSYHNIFSRGTPGIISPDYS
jgi:hypothetical protein